MRKDACLITVLAIFAAVLFSFVVHSGASVRHGGDVLEEALNRFGGTRLQWNALADDGGVQEHDRWNPINRICGFKEKDWDMTSSGNFLSGTAENSRCSARYLPEGEKYWTYSIRRLAKAAK